MSYPPNNDAVVEGMEGMLDTNLPVSIHLRIDELQCVAAGSRDARGMLLEFKYMFNEAARACLYS